jgi:hypothetical protein
MLIIDAARTRRCNPVMDKLDGQVESDHREPFEQFLAKKLERQELERQRSRERLADLASEVLACAVALAIMVESETHSPEDFS